MQGKSPPPLVYNESERSCVTDLQILVQRGFAEEEAREALANSRGDINQATYLLKAKKIDNSWIGELKGEWEDSAQTTAATPEIRALWKTPHYVRVNSWARVLNKDGSKEEVRFKVSRISRDGQQSTMLKKFSKFYTFWMSLPVGSTRHLKNPFPKTGLFQFVDESNQALDERTTLLDEWCRELCLDEKCMTNPKILSALDQFFISAQVTAPLIGDIEPDNMDSWIVIPENTVKSIPVPLATLQRNLPTKIDPSLLFGSCRNSMAFAGSITGSDLSEDQLRKDLSRDRIVMQGRRIAGATSSLEAIIDLGVNTAQAVTTLHNVKPFGEDLLRDLCRRALVQVSRTESAFASHYALQAILDPSTDPNIIILPEASLAKPLLMQFRVAPSSDTTPGPRRSNTSTENDEDAGASTTAVRPRRMSALAKMGKAMSVSQGDVPAESIGPLESKDLICDIQATTVFRFVAADSMETTVLQVRVTFCKSMKVKQPGENEESALFAKTCLNPFGEDSPRPAGSTNPFGADSVDVGDDNKGVGDFPRTPSADNEDLCACPERPEVSRFNHLYLDSNTVIVIEQDTHLTSRDFV